MATRKRRAAAASKGKNSKDKGSADGSADKDSPKDAPAAKPPAQPKVKSLATPPQPYLVTLKDGASYGYAGIDFVSGRARKVSDPRIIEMVSRNNRFLVQPLVKKVATQKKGKGKGKGKGGGK